MFRSILCLERHAAERDTVRGPVSTPRVAPALTPSAAPIASSVPPHLVNGKSFVPTKSTARELERAGLR